MEKNRDLREREHLPAFSFVFRRHLSELPPTAGRLKDVIPASCVFIIDTGAGWVTNNTYLQVTGEQEQPDFVSECTEQRCEEDTGVLAVTTPVYEGLYWVPGIVVVRRRNIVGNVFKSVDKARGELNTLAIS